MKCSKGMQQGTYQRHFKRRPRVTRCKTCLGSWCTSKGCSLETIFHGMGLRRSFAFLVSLPNGCARVKRGHQKAVLMEQRARPTSSSLFLGPVVRGHLSRQLSRHCSLPGKSTSRDVLGQAREWVRVLVKMGFRSVWARRCLEDLRFCSGFVLLLIPRWPSAWSHWP